MSPFGTSLYMKHTQKVLFIRVFIIIRILGNITVAGSTAEVKVSLPVHIYIERHCAYKSTCINKFGLMKYPSHYVAAVEQAPLTSML